MIIEIKALAFEGPKSGPDRGFTMKAYYLHQPEGDALVEVYREGEPFRRFLYPAYKIWNLAAHFSDIVDGEIDGGMAGYDLAGWNGFAVVMPREI
jgi:hypothetical protein